MATRNAEALFSKVADKKMPGLDTIYAMPNGVHMAEVNGRDVLVNIFSDQRGWKYVYAIDADEVFAGTYAMLRISVIFSLVMAVAVFILGALILRSINRPLGLLSSTSETIADGDIQAALPDRALFSGELLSLYESFAKCSPISTRLCAVPRKANKKPTVRKKRPAPPCCGRKRRARRPRPRPQPCWAWPKAWIRPSGSFPTLPARFRSRSSNPTGSPPNRPEA